MRLFLFCTPRTGNTWLRLLLSDSLELPSHPVVTPDKIDWSVLPQDCLLSLHWPRTPELERRLGDHGFRVVVPQECVSDRADGPHFANLFDINAKYGDVLPLADVIGALRAMPADVGERRLAAATR